MGKRVIGVSRFSDMGLREKLNEAGIETVSCDLMDEDAVKNLPDAQNVIYMVGRKFGTEEDSSLTWAINTYPPAVVSKRFRNSRITVFSTGNVYPLVPISSGGADELILPNPIGEYAQSCLGRERVFDIFQRNMALKSCF